MRAKKLKFAESGIKLDEIQLAEIMKRDETLMFAKALGGARSVRALEYFEMKQEEIGRYEEELVAKNEIETSNHTVLSDAAVSTGN